MKKIVGFVFLSLVVFSNHVFGQASTCTQTLRLVQSTYEQGRLHELETLMAECLKSGFDEQQKVNAYRYLTLAYIYLEEPEKADESMLALLNTGQAGHFFKPNDLVDPAEFIALYRKFRTEPLFRFGGKVGMTSTLPAISETFYVGSNAEGNGQFSPRFGFSVLGVFEKDFPDFIKNFSIAPEIGFISRSYNYSNPFLTAKDETPDNPNFRITENIQKQSWFDLNLLVQYKIKDNKKGKDNKFNPYIGIGPGISYLSGSTNEIQTEVIGLGTITGSAIVTKSSYKSLAYSAIITLGSKFRVGGFYLTGDIRYQYGLNNVVDESNRSESEALFDYGFVPPNYRHNNVTFNLGLVIPHFNPKKLIK